MSRPLALFAVAALAFCVAPRPVTLEPPPREVDWELIVPTPEVIVGYVLTDEDPGLDTKIEGLEIERLAKETVDFVTQDNIGPPRLAPIFVPSFAPDDERVLVVVDKPPSALRPAPAFRHRVPWLNWKDWRESGLNNESVRSVALGLAWLAKQQKQDGGWQFEAGEWKDDRIAATGLALLPLLGVGQTHKNADDQWGKYRKTVKGGLDFLMKNCPPSGGQGAGKMSNNMYAQAIGTLALCEANGMTRDPLLMPHVQAALNFLQRSQGANGGWSEVAGAACDVHTTGWVVQALFAAQTLPDLVVDDRVIKRAVAFLNTVADGPRKATYGTTDRSDAKPGTTATAIGLLCRHLIDGWGASHPGMIDGVAWLERNPPSATSRDPPYLYYATWVMRGYEGAEWKNWNEGPKAADGIRRGGARELLTNSQFRKDGGLLGSWEPEGDFGQRYGRLGTTALSVLTLEVYYRYLPLYKRGADGNAVRIFEDR